MKSLEINTDNFDFNHLPEEPVENILISGHTINCFGIFIQDYPDFKGDLDCMAMKENDRQRYKWLLTQIVKYNANIDIICEKDCFDYYINLLTCLDIFEVKHNIKLFKNF